MEIEEIKEWAPKLARSVLRNCLLLKKGDTLTMEVWTYGLSWIDAFQAEARRIGARPMVIYEDEDAFWTALEEGHAKSLGSISPQEWAALKETNTYIFFWGPADRSHWHRLPSSTLKVLTAYEEEWFRMFKEKGIRWCRIELTRATEELAKEYGISYSGWVKELLEASVVNPAQMVRNGRRVAERFQNGREVRITHPNGTDLELRLRGRRPFVDDGVVDEADVKSGFGESNIPSGCVQVAVDETYAEGVFKANRPTRHGSSKGRSDGGQWTFEKGKLVKYSYRQGERDFSRPYRKAGPEREHPAVLSIGLNPKIHDSPLFEDQELGTVTMHIGSNEWLGGSSRGDYGSWLFLRGADLSVDSESLLKSGKIV